MTNNVGSGRPLRIMVHDFAGHPFQIQLSRELANRGHHVVHAYCASLTTTPTGALERLPGDSSNLVIEPIRLSQPLEKYQFVKRWQQENEYGKLLAQALRDHRPDVVLSGNTPLDAQRRALAASRRKGIRFVHWAQDLIGLATKRLLHGRWRGAGDLVGNYYLRLERRILRKSDAVVVISEDFTSTLVDWGVDRAAIAVIENWAPLDEVPMRPKDNPWSRERGFGDALRFVYTGTLGLKHNPDLLLQLALSRPDINVIVVSQGKGAHWLSDRRDEMIVSNLHVLGFQPFEHMPDVLGSADVLVAVLEPEADVFSVPSKVLTYLCASRPVLLAVPLSNLAARIVERIGCGIVVPPTDTAAFLEGAERLIRDAPLREAMGPKARAYAEQTFDIHRIASRFEKVLDPAAK